VKAFCPIPVQFKVNWNIFVVNFRTEWSDVRHWSIDRQFTAKVE